jgi:hypothetical protein
MWEAKENPDQPLPTARIRANRMDRVLAVIVPAIWIAACLSAPAIYRSVERSLDNSGWIPHSHDTPTWIQGDWLAGEYRICEMPGYLWGGLPESAHLLCSSGDPRAVEGVWPAGFRESLSSDEAYRIDMGLWYGLERHFHILPVKYWGRIDRTDRTGFSWRCQKQAGGLECKALN